MNERDRPRTGQPGYPWPVVNAAALAAELRDLEERLGIGGDDGEVTG